MRCLGWCLPVSGRYGLQRVSVHMPRRRRGPCRRPAADVTASDGDGFVVPGQHRRHLHAATAHHRQIVRLERGRTLRHGSGSHASAWTNWTRRTPSTIARGRAETRPQAGARPLAVAPVLACAGLEPGRAATGHALGHHATAKPEEPQQSTPPTPPTSPQPTD